MVDGTFARHLKCVVMSTGLSIPDFASLVGMREATLRTWLAGKGEPQGLQRLRTIKRLTGCTWKELLG